MATEIFKTIAELEYKVSGEGLDKTLNFLDKQIEKSKILESQVNRLMKLQENTPGLAASQKYIDILGRTQKELVGVTNGIQNVFLKNNDFNKSLIQTVGYAEAAKLKLAALSKSQSISPTNEGANAIGVLKNSLGNNLNISSLKSLAGSALESSSGLITKELEKALPIGGELLSTITEFAPQLALAAGAAYLLYKYFDDTSAQAKLLKQDVEDVNKKTAENATNELTNVRVLYEASQNQTLSLKERKKAVDELQSQYPSYFANLSDEAILAGKAYKQYDLLTQSILNTAKAQAVKSKIQDIYKEGLEDIIKLDEINKKNVKIEEENRKNNVGTQRVVSKPILINGKVVGFEKPQVVEEQTGPKFVQRTDKENALVNRVGDINARVENLVKFFGLDGFTKENKSSNSTPQKATKEIRESATNVKNIYLEELAKLEQQLSNATLKIEISPKIIESKFKADLEKENLRIEDLLKEGKITKIQSTKLKAKAGEVSAELLKKSLEDYSGDVKKIQDGFAEKIKELKDKDTALDLAALSDGFEKESRLIEFESKKSAERLTEERDKLLSKAEEDLKKFTDPQVQASIKASVAQINKNFDELQTDIEVERFNKLRVAAEKAFDKIKEKITETTSLTRTGAETVDNKEVDSILKQYIDKGGNIDKVRKQIADIRKTQAVENINANISDRKQKLEANTNEIGSTLGTITSERLEKLRKENAQYEKEISELEIALDEAKITKKEDKQKQIIKNIGYGVQIEEAFVSAISKVLSAQEANIDKEIALQERRIERTKAIAERGNAELLEQEEERLRRNQELKERYARQQLALQLVQQAGALTLAIANAATLGFPAAIPAIATIIATIGAGFATVKQLSASNTPRFKDGVVGFNGKGTGTSDDNLVRISNKESVVIAKAIEHADNRVILEGMNKGYRYNLTKQIDNSIYKDAVSSNQTHNYEDLRQEIAGLRKDMSNRKATSINLDKRAILTVTEEVAREQRQKWQV
jgi:hypothetical protein